MNIDRLHEVMDGKLKGRGVGHTTAKCYEVLGMFQLKDVLGIDKIYCKMQYHGDWQVILGQMLLVFKEQSIFPKVVDARQTFIVDGLEIKFVPEHLFNEMKGIDNCAIVDFTEEYNGVE